MRWFSIDQVAEYFETSRQTVSAWIESGELKAEDHSRTRGKNRRLRINSESIEAFSRIRSTHPIPTTTRRRIRRRSERLVNEFSPSR